MAKSTMTAFFESGDVFHSLRWRDAFRQLNNLQFLNFDWDGFGSVPVSEDVFSAAIDLLQNLECANEPAPRVSPTPDGGVTLEWRSQNYLREAEIDNPLSVEWMERKNGQVEHWTSDIPKTVLKFNNQTPGVSTTSWTGMETGQVLTAAYG